VFCDFDKVRDRVIFQMVWHSKKKRPGGVTWMLAIKFDLQSLGEGERKVLITPACRLNCISSGHRLLVADQFTNKSNCAPFEILYRSASSESFFVTPTDQGASGD
jgi:hypothetical protein